MFFPSRWLTHSEPSQAKVFLNPKVFTTESKILICGFRDRASELGKNKRWRNILYFHVIETTTTTSWHGLGVVCSFPYPNRLTQSLSKKYWKGVIQTTESQTQYARPTLFNSRFFPAWTTQMTSWIWSDFFCFKFCEKRMHGNCFQMNHLISNSFSFEKDIQYFTLREEIILHPRIFKISNFSFETCPSNMNSIFSFCCVFFNSTSN